jgi:hypothetical protein
LLLTLSIAYLPLSLMQAQRGLTPS